MDLELRYSSRVRPLCRRSQEYSKVPPGVVSCLAFTCPMKCFVELIAVAALLMLGACRKDPARISTAAPPAAVDYFKEGEKQFRIGNYAEAEKAYDTHLRSQPAAENQDLTLMRLAIVYAVAPDPVRNSERSAASLNRLVSSFPQSTWRPQAELMLELHAKVGKLQSEVGEKDDTIRRLMIEAEAAQKLDEEALRTRRMKGQEQVERNESRNKGTGNPDSQPDNRNRRNARTTSAPRARTRRIEENRPPETPPPARPLAGSHRIWYVLPWPVRVAFPPSSLSGLPTTRCEAMSGSNPGAV